VIHVYYILDGSTPVPCDDVVEWAKWFEHANRQVALTRVGSWTVSTIFIGIDLSLGCHGAPRLFETLAFGESVTELGGRTPTWKDAEELHQKTVALLKERIN
jgi:hypothetical protein